MTIPPGEPNLPQIDESEKEAEPNEDPVKAFEEMVEEYIEDMEIETPSDAIQVDLSLRSIAEMLNHACIYYSANQSPEANLEVMGLLIGWETEANHLHVYRTYPVTQGSPISVQFREEHFKVFEKLNLNEQKGEFVLGWYHSHPGLEVFLSAIDINTHASSFQGQNGKSIAVVVDPAEAPSNAREWMTIKNLSKAIKAYQVETPNQPLSSKYFSLPLTIEQKK